MVGQYVISLQPNVSVSSRHNDQTETQSPSFLNRGLQLTITNFKFSVIKIKITLLYFHEWQVLISETCIFILAWIQDLSISGQLLVGTMLPPMLHRFYHYLLF